MSGSSEPVVRFSARRLILGAASTAVTVALMALILHAIEPEAALWRLANLPARHLATMAGLAAFQNLVLLPVKLWLILFIDGIRITYYESLLFRMTGLALKFLLPFKIGEAAKVVYLKRVQGYDVSRGVGFVLFDKVTALSGLLLLVLLGCLTVPGYRAWAAPALLALGICWATLLTPLAGWLVHLLPFLPPKARDALEGMAHLFHRNSRRARLGVLLYSSALMAYDMLYYYVALHAVGAIVPASWILLRVPLVYLATALPVTLYGIGAREGTVMLLLAGFASPEQLFVAGALVSTFEIMMFTVIGTAFFPSFFLRVRRGRGAGGAGEQVSRSGSLTADG